MPQTDLIIHGAQIATCAGGPRRGAALTDVGLIPDGAVAVSDGVIAAVGPTADVLADYDAAQFIDADGKTLTPGFVDPHTHAVWAGDRAHEFEMRIQGATYMEIMRAGGGIASTARATRDAPLAELTRLAEERLRHMLWQGTTTLEIKSGYGLTTEAEIVMLRTIEELADRSPQHIVPTFLGAHAVPPEYAGDPDGYIDLVIGEMVPAAAEWFAFSPFAEGDAPFCSDVFCEEGAFDVTQSQRVLEAGRAAGMGVRAHVDEFNALGGTPMALELGALSVDHLDVTPPEDIAALAASDAVGVILPAVNFNLGSTHFADARAMIEAGAFVALATDLNPGSAPCYGLPTVMAIATRYQRLTPAEALNMVTINAAHALGLSESIGSVEVGKRADLLIINAPDYRHLAYAFGVNLVESVFIAGRVV